MADVVLPSEVRRALVAAFGEAEVIVLHAACRRIGYVAGGVDAILAAVLDVLGPERTLLVPTFTPDLVDPASWIAPRAPEEEWARIRAELPVFDAVRSAPRGMGRLADLVRWLPAARRSHHPAESVAAIGPRAEALVAPHPIDDPLGPRSPWARLVACDARVLLLGVGLERCTLLHHAERLADVAYARSSTYVVPVDLPLVEWDERSGIVEERSEEGGRERDRRTWVEVESGGACSSGFPYVEPRLREGGALLSEGAVGRANIWAYSARRMVEVAQALLAADPAALLCPVRSSCAACADARLTLARGDGRHRA